MTLSKLVVHLCRACKGSPDGLGLQAALDRALPGDVTVSLSECLEQCAAPQALALQRAGGASYVFSGLDPEADQADIVATCQAYLDATDGWIDDARPCGRLRFCLAARLPA